MPPVSKIADNHGKPLGAPPESLGGAPCCTLLEGNRVVNKAHAAHSSGV
jgi:hypothetical protein